MLAAKLPDPGVDSVPVADSTARGLCTNCWAKIEGLPNKPSLNGSPCRLLFWHGESERWACRSPGSGRTLRLRPSNLKLTSAPAPFPKLRGGVCNKSKELISIVQREIEDYLMTHIETSYAGAAGIRRIFQALAASPTFVSDIFGKQPFVIECSEAVAHQWSVRDSISILSANAYPDCAPANDKPITLSKNSKFTHPEISTSKAHSFMAAANDNEAPVEPLTEKVARARLRSATWVIHGGNSLAPTLADICEAVQDAFAIPFVTTNVYMSRLDSTVTAPLHTDRFDSFIFQTEGSKRWRVFNTSSAVPIWPVVDAGMSDRGKHGDVLYLEQVGPLMLDERLDPGDVLYLPRGHPHATSTFDTSSLHFDAGIGQRSQAKHSTSLTVSLLLESLGLTYDKILRCAGGLLEGRNNMGQCAAAEEVLHATAMHKELREVLPVGFLGHDRLSVAACASEHLSTNGSSWAASLASEAFRRASLFKLKQLLARESDTRAVLLQIATQLEQSLPAGMLCCKDKVYATGSALRGLHPDERHHVEERALIDFPFYPEDGRMYVQAPNFQSQRPAL